jgi:hypothetical protein
VSFAALQQQQQLHTSHNTLQHHHHHHHSRQHSRESLLKPTDGAAAGQAQPGLREQSSIYREGKLFVIRQSRFFFWGFFLFHFSRARSTVTFSFSPSQQAGERDPDQTRPDPVTPWSYPANSTTGCFPRLLALPLALLASGCTGHTDIFLAKAGTLPSTNAWSAPKRRNPLFLVSFRVFDSSAGISQ